MKRILILMALLAIFVGAASAATVTVGFSGDGADYTCDGSSDDVQINAALAKVAGTGGTVYLKGDRPFVISNPIKIGDSTILTGDSGAVIKLANNAKWDKGVPMIKNVGSKGDITIHGFEIDGNYANNNEHGRGAWYYTLISLGGVKNIKIYDMYLHDNAFDLIYISKCSNVEVYDNTARNQGHEFVWLYECNGAKVYNNDMAIQTNSGIRAEATNNLKIYNNDIYATVSGGYAGIYVRSYSKNSPVTSVEIYNNNIHDLSYAGIYVIAYNYDGTTKDLTDKSQSTGLYIHDNVISKTGSSNKAPGGGISSAGFHNTIIEKNKITGVKGNGISILYNEPALSYTGVVYYIRNNIITSPSGSAIKNYETSTHTIVTEGSSTPIEAADSGDSVQNVAPTAKITSISPTSATTGTSVSFKGSGTDTDGTITAYKWRSSISGQLSSSASFSSSKLAAGKHTIYFSVKDNKGTWSKEVTSTVTINAGSNVAPTAKIISISPTTAKKGTSVSFKGSGSDKDGKIVAYKWRSNISGQLSSSASFSSSKLAPGKHTIYFSVKDNKGKWSKEVPKTLVIKP
ncbi:MAG: right-handed parallel beta-helix repeat-containing protein [Methanolobus sp.]